MGASHNKTGHACSKSAGNPTHSLKTQSIQVLYKNVLRPDDLTMVKPKKIK